MTDTPLDPKNTLNAFFTTEGELAFYDETQPLGHFSAARTQAELVNTNFGTSTSNLHITTSTGGGAVSLVTPTVPLNQMLLINFIKSHNLSPDAPPSVHQIQVDTTYLLQFTIEPNDQPYQVPFKNSKLEVTHQESTNIVNAIQGHQGKCALITCTQFTVICAVQAKLEADWLVVLKLAVETKKTDKDALIVLIDQQITAGVIHLQQNYVNTPKASTEIAVKDSLIETAALLAANTLKGISDTDDLPDKVNYDIHYNQSVPQTYQWNDTQDLADKLSRIPFNTIVSSSPTPLPDPGRKPEPPVSKTDCEVSLGFEPNDYQILSITFAWANQKDEMAWPNFPPITLTAEGKPAHLEVTVTFSDYTKFVHELPWQSQLVITPENIGFCTVSFDAQAISEYFNNITGSAQYWPNNSAKKQSFQFSFSDQTWEGTWLVRTLTQGLDGQIKYQWTGERKSLFHKTYDSGKQQSTSDHIELQYHSFS